MKVLLVLVAHAAAALAACGGQGPAQRSAAAPDIQARAAPPAPEAHAAATPVHARKRAEARPAPAPSAAQGNAMEVTVRAGTKLSDIRKGVGLLRSQRGAPQAKSQKRKSRPLVAISPPAAEKKTDPAPKKGPSLLDRLAQGKLPSK